MMSLPDKDRYGQTKEWLIGRLAIAFGGRVAEELIFGPDKVTTGRRQRHRAGDRRSPGGW